MHKGKTLIQEIENEERDRINLARSDTFKAPDYRTGDVLKVQIADSLSEGKIQEWSGVCFATQKTMKNIRANVSINMNVEGYNTSLKIPLYSPLTKGLEIQRYGSNKNRTKLNHIPQLDLPPGRLREPVIKGRNYKIRGSTSKAPQQQTHRKRNKGKIRRYIDAQSGVTF